MCCFSLTIQALFILINSLLLYLSSFSSKGYCRTRGTGHSPCISNTNSNLRSTVVDDKIIDPLLE